MSAPGVSTDPGPRRRARDERGMTLVELIVSITILSIIMASLTTAVTVYLQRGNDIADDARGNDVVRFATTHWTRDVERAATIAFDEPATCGDAKSALASFAWADAASDANAASWTVEPGEDGIDHLVRRQCRDGTELVTNDLGRVVGGAKVACPSDCTVATTLQIVLGVSATRTEVVVATRRVS
jgi:prepilin-type N-terminal cleavage/methylation domain-containing protein